MCIRDRMGYPDYESQVNILRDRQLDNPLEKAKEILTDADILKM